MVELAVGYCPERTGSTLVDDKAFAFEPGDDVELLWPDVVGYYFAY